MEDLTTWNIFTTSSSTYSTSTFLTPPMSNTIKFQDDYLAFRDSEKVEVPFIDPFNIDIDSNDTKGGSGNFYRTFYISRIVIIPSILMMIACSIILMYVILRHLKSVMKLYLSVLFYAASTLFFASQISTKILQSQVFGII